MARRPGTFRRIEAIVALLTALVGVIVCRSSVRTCSLKGVVYLEISSGSRRVRMLLSAGNI